MRSIFCIFLLLIVITACKTVEYQENEGCLIEIDSRQDMNSMLIFDSIVTNFHFIPLETNTDALIGKINKVIFSKTRIFICDTDVSNSVFIFDEFGSFIKKITGGSKGPGEFTRPQSISMDYNNDLLVVMDDRMKKILTFDKNGIFLHEGGFKFTTNDIARINEDLFAFSSGFSASSKKIDFHDLIYTSYAGTNRTKYKPLPAWRNNTIYTKTNPFCQYFDSIWYTPVYCDSVFLIQESGPLPVFKINFSKDFINGETGPSIDFSDMPRNCIESIRNFQKAGRFIYYSFSRFEKEYNGSILHHVFHDLDTHNKKVGVALISSVITQGFFTHPIASNGTEFVAMIEAIDLVSKIERQLTVTPNLSGELNFLLETVKPGDNPILIFYSLNPIVQ